MATNPSAFPGSFAPAVLASQNWPWMPADAGLLAASASIDGMGTSFTPVAGTVYLMKVPTRAAYLLANVSFIINTAGVGASTGSFAGVYSSAGTLLSGSADIGAALLGTGGLPVPLTTPQPQAAGSFCWYAFLCNLATTQPVLRAWAAPSSAVANFGLTAATARTASAGTLQTTLPLSITPSANTPIGSTIWTGGN